MATVDASTSDQSNHFASGVLLAILGTFLFALKSIFIKLAYAAGAEPTPLLTLRLFFALPFYAFVFWRVQSGEQSQSISRVQYLRAISLGLLGYYFASYLDLSGLQYITAQLERLTLFVYPAIVAVLAWMFLGEALNRRIGASILLCYLGVAMMYGQEKAISESEHVAWGVFLVSGSAIAYSFYILFAKPIMQKIGSRQFTSLAMIGSTLFVGLHFGLTRDLSELLAMPPVIYLYGMILAIVCTLVPSFMINEAIMRVGATRTAVIGSSGPVLTMLLAIVVLNEPSSLWHFAGMAIAIIGVSLVTKK